MKRFVTDTLGLLRETLELWLEKNAFQLGGALAFYTLFSLAPLLIIVITIAGLVFGEEAVQGELSAQMEEFIGPRAAVTVEQAIQASRVEEAGLLPTILGVGLLLFGATTVFAQLQNSLNQIWDVTARPTRSGILVFLLSRALSLGLVLLIGLVALTSFAASVALSAAIRFADEWIPVHDVLVRLADVVISLAVFTLLFALIFKILPDVRLSVRDMWPGALLTGVLFMVGQSLISLYLTQAAPASAYGAAGSLVLILMWVYYVSLILFLGAAFTRVWIRRWGGPVETAPGAVHVRRQLVEEPEDLQEAPLARERAG